MSMTTRRGQHGPADARDRSGLGGGRYEDTARQLLPAARAAVKRAGAGAGRPGPRHRLRHR